MQEYLARRLECLRDELEYTSESAAKTQGQCVEIRELLKLDEQAEKILNSNGYG